MISVVLLQDSLRLIVVQTDQELSVEDKTQIWIEVILLAALVAFPLWAALAVPASTSHWTLFQDGLMRLAQYIPICGLVLYFMSRSGKGKAHFGLGRNRDFFGVVSFVGGLIVVGFFCIWLDDTLRQAVQSGMAEPDLSQLGPVPYTTMQWIGMLPVLYVGAAFEELVFRGFMVARLLEATNNRWLAVFFPSVIFGSYHIYQGWEWLVGSTIYGILFSWMFMEWRRLKALIWAHFAFNAVAFSYYLY